MNGSSTNQPQQHQQQQQSSSSISVSSPLNVNKNSLERYSPAPQPPQRSNHLRSSLVRNNTVLSQSTTNETNPLSPIICSKGVHNTQASLNNATNEATKLVYKSAGTGSVQSLNMPNQEILASQMQLNRNTTVNKILI